MDEERLLRKLYSTAGITHIDFERVENYPLGRDLRQYGFDFALKTFIEQFRRQEQGKGYNLRDSEDRSYDSRDHTYCG